MKACLGVVLALGILMSAGARAEQDCRLHIVASLPMTLLESNRIMVSAEIRGKTVPLLVDTGSPVSILTQSSVERLGLKRHALPFNVEFRMFGGKELVFYVNVRNLKIGGMTARRSQFLVMPEGMEDYGGLLGWNFLSQFDVDFDFANGKMNLFQPHPCEGKAVYWTQDESAIAKIPFRTKNERHIFIPVRLDGKDVDALIDTGATNSVMNTETAESLFGIDENSPGMRAVGNPKDPTYTYPFKTLVFEGVTVNHPRIGLYPRSKSHFRDNRVILGITVLRHLHLFVAYKERQLYITAADQH